MALADLGSRGRNNTFNGSAHLEGAGTGEEHIRIISARRTSKLEKKIYEKEN